MRAADGPDDETHAACHISLFFLDPFHPHDVAALDGVVTVSPMVEGQVMATANGLASGALVATFRGDAPYCCVTAAGAGGLVVAGDTLGRLHILEAERFDARA